MATAQRDHATAGIVGGLRWASAGRAATASSAASAAEQDAHEKPLPGAMLGGGHRSGEEHSERRRALAADALRCGHRIGVGVLLGDSGQRGRRAGASAWTSSPGIAATPRPSTARKVAAPSDTARRRARALTTAAPGAAAPAPRAPPPRPGSGPAGLRRDRSILRSRKAMACKAREARRCSPARARQPGPPRDGLHRRRAHGHKRRDSPPEISHAFSSSCPCPSRCLPRRPRPSSSPPRQPELGQRTQSPEALFREMSSETPEQEMAAAGHGRQRLSARHDRESGAGRRAGGRARLSRPADLRGRDAAPHRHAQRGRPGRLRHDRHAYGVACGGTTRRIVFDMYHQEHVENRAPAGFNIRP